MSDAEKIRVLVAAIKRVLTTSAISQAPGARAELVAALAVAEKKSRRGHITGAGT